MGREMLPGVIDTINSISLSIVVGGLLGIVGFIFITFLYSEKRDPEFFPIKEEPISKHEEQNGGH